MLVWIQFTLHVYTNYMIIITLITQNDLYPNLHYVPRQPLAPHGLEILSMGIKRLRYDTIGNHACRYVLKVTLVCKIV